MPQNERSPAFPVYTKDFLSDPNVMAMDNRQVGVYWKLILICWQQEGLPRDDKMLAAMVGEKMAWWKTHSPIILACFVKKGRKFDHARLMAERKVQLKRRLGRAAAGRKGNEIRWGKQQDRSQGDTDAIAKDRLASSSSSSSAKSKSKKDADASCRADAIAAIAYLNIKTGKSFKPGEHNLKFPIARLHTMTLTDLSLIVDAKTAEWLNDSERQQYLRPQTLFGTKAESYLEAAKAEQRRTPGVSKLTQKNIENARAFVEANGGER